MTTEITKKVLESMKEKDKKKKERQRTIEILRSTSCIDLSENDDEQDDTPQPQVKKRKFVSSSNVRGPIDDVYKPDHGKGKQTTLDKNNPIKEKLKKVAWKKIAVWAYSVGLPFNVVRDEGFQDAINAIGEYGRGNQFCYLSYLINVKLLTFLYLLVLLII